MRVAILTPGGVDRTGTERVIPCLLWLIERLVRGGDEVHVFALNQEPTAGRWPLLGAEVHNAGRRPRTLRMLSMTATEHRLKPFDIVHAFWADPCGLVGAAASRLLRVPLLLTLPGGDAARIPSIGYGGRLYARGRAILRLATAAAAAVTVPSEAMRAQAEEAGMTAVCVPLGVALDKWPPSPPRRRDAGAPIRLLHVGNLNPVKDQRTLLDAASILNREGIRFEMQVVGWDTLGGTIQRQAAERGLSSIVHFGGFMPHAALRPLFERADLLVVSSRHEAGPLVVLEAAIAGVPTVGTAVGHIADFAPGAAIAIPVGDGAALADGIARLAANESDRLCVAQEAQKRALAIDANLTASRFRELYREVTGR